MVQNGLDVNQKRNMSVAPLSIAAEKGNLRMVSLLVQAGAKVSLIPLYCSTFIFILILAVGGCRW